MAVTESAHLQGVLLAIEEINAARSDYGFVIRPTIKEPGSNDQKYGDYVHQFLDDDINIIFGCCASTSRKAVLPIIERRGGLLFYPSFYEGFEYSPNIIYSGATPNQTVLPLTEYLFANYGRNFYLVGSDYIYPREINRIIKEYMYESDGQIAGEKYIPLGAGENKYQRIAENIKAVMPAAIISTVVGMDTKVFYSACHNAGIETKTCPIASLTTSEGELAQMPADIRAGHITSTSYFQSICSGENAKFIEKFKSRYGNGAIPNTYSETTYFQVYMFANAVRRAASGDWELILNTLKDSEINAPQGRVMLDSATNHIYIRPRIGLSNSQGLFDLLWESSGHIKPDPYLVTYDRVIADKFYLN